MTDCRRYYVVGVLILFLGSAFAASAQPAGQCTLSSGVPPLIRAEGLAELVADLVFTCSNLIPNGGRQVDIQLLLNTSSTSRILNTATGQTESLLLLDEPSPGSTVMCPNIAGCISGAANAFQGQLFRGNGLLFRGIPIDGTGTTRTLRITNVRVHADGIGAGGLGLPGQAVAFVSASPPATMAMPNPQQLVGYIQPGLGFVHGTAGAREVIAFLERYPTAFKLRVAVGGDGKPVPQDGHLFSTESGFYPGGTIGLADFGTRLKAVFSNIPVGAVVSVPLQLTDATTGAIATLITSESGAFQPAQSRELIATNGIAVAVWELTSLGGTSNQRIDRLSGEVSVNSSTHAVVGSFAPASTEIPGSPTAPIPRFADRPATIPPPAPFINPQMIDGMFGLGGWSRSNVTVSWTVDDPVFGIASTTGCDTTTVTAEGTTTLTCSATNRIGVANSVSVPVFIDKTPPILSGLPAAGCTLWPPNHRLVQVATIVASDALSGTYTFDVTARSNEPADPKDPIIVITGAGLEPRTVQLRADRLASGSGRVYTISARVVDFAGNVASQIATCTVPHDQGK